MLKSTTIWDCALLQYLCTALPTMFESWLCHWLVVWPWEMHWTSLYLMSHLPYSRCYQPCQPKWNKACYRTPGTQRAFPVAHWPSLPPPSHSPEASEQTRVPAAGAPQAWPWARLATLPLKIKLLGSGPWILLPMVLAFKGALDRTHLIASGRNLTWIS